MNRNRYRKHGESLKRPRYGWTRRWWTAPADALLAAMLVLLAAASCTAIYGIVDLLAALNGYQP